MLSQTHSAFGIADPAGSLILHYFIKYLKIDSRCIEEDLIDERYIEEYQENRKKVIKEEKEEMRKQNICKSKRQSIKILVKSSGEVLEFETKSDCLKFLGCSPNTFVKFLNNESKKLSKLYVIVE